MSKAKELISILENMPGVYPKQRMYDGGANYCKCPKCGYEEARTNLPCDQIKCPKCETPLNGIRAEISNYDNDVDDVIEEVDADSDDNTLIINDDEILNEE